ncbi:MAG TPA: DUF2934 domain-containing protein [Bryobacteraceae bacterium]|nr:DUF2934 domain-containing protein [Bryobacteraceae bacterium]
MPKKKANEATVAPSPVSAAAVPSEKKTRTKPAARPAVEQATKPAVVRKKAAPKATVPVVSEPVEAEVTEVLTLPVWETSQLEELAYQSWLERGRPVGSPDEDWYRAEKKLIALAAVATK